MLMLVTRPDARLPEIVRAAVDGGVNMVQVRGAADLEAVREAAGRARVVINAVILSREDGEGPPSQVGGGSFASLRMTGVHLPESAPFVKAPFVGRSVHSLEAAVRAEAEGCQYVVVGTIFPSTSHLNGPVAGVALIERIAKNIDIPVLAIGGIDATNARACIDAGARGVAVISAIMDAQDPRKAAQELWRAIA
jgi:thiamine-phosphate pyrophosphorylase